MIALPERQQILQWVEEASAAGARAHKACELLGASQVAMMHVKDDVSLMRVLIDVINSARVERRGSTDKPMHLVTLGKQQLRQV